MQYMRMMSLWPCRSKYKNIEDELLGLAHLWLSHCLSVVVATFIFLVSWAKRVVCISKCQHILIYMPTSKISLLPIWNYHTSYHVESFWDFLVKILDCGVIGFLLLFHSALWRRVTQEETEFCTLGVETFPLKDDFETIVFSVEELFLFKNRMVAEHIRKNDRAFWFIE